MIIEETVMRRFLVLVMVVFAVTFCKREEQIALDRSFYMGFSPWPYDNTIEAQNWVYSTINQYGDIISEHLEEGVPWPESYTNSPFPQEYINEIQSRLQRIGINQKVLLQISPLNISRNGLANYRGSSPNLPLPQEWSSLALNDEKVKLAYLNYAKRMIQYFSPDFLLLGVESNLLIRNNPSIWPKYLELHQFVYTELKKIYPTLQLSVSVFCVPYFPQWSSEDNLTKQLSGLNEITPFVDFISFSVHPFMSGLQAESFPSDYFQKLFSYTPKPIAISESSYPAQAWETLTPPFISFNGTEAKQANFLKLMLEESRKANAKFVIWYSVRDFDALWRNLLNGDPLALIWRDTGLFAEDGTEREAFGVWRVWYARNIK